MTEHLDSALHVLVRSYFPSFDRDQVDSIIWECTCFPFGTFDAVRQNLEDLAAKANDFAAALYVAYGEFDREWAEMDEPDYEFDPTPTKGPTP